MVDVPKELAGKLVEATMGGKVISTQVVNCRQYGNENIDAVVVVFNNGRIEISCPIGHDKCICGYEARWKALRRKWWQSPIATAVAAILAISFFIVLNWLLFVRFPVS
jgi:hypothetical protein